MPEPIALVTRLNAGSEREWREELAAALPGERIVPFRDLGGAERGQVRIAVVADPEPADVAALSGLAWVQSVWAGVERLVQELGASAPPIVRLVDPELARVMGEAVLAWTYYLQRDMPAYRRTEEAGLWCPRVYRHPREVVVGLLGYGALGREAAARLRGAGFPVQAWARAPRPSEDVPVRSGPDGLAELLGSSDVVVCLVPLTQETRGLLDHGRFGLMRRGAALINFARGAVVVAGDLLAQLDAGHLSHAVLDVFEEEPLPPASPLWRHPDVTVLPHVSAPTDRRSAAAIVAANVAAYRADGRLPRTVDMALGY